MGSLDDTCVPSCPKGPSSVVHSLFQREISGTPLYRSSSPFGKCVPERLNMPMESILPTWALRNGHIFLGFTDCGRFLLSYTSREEFDTAYNRSEMTFIYKLYIWLFVPYKLAKRVASTVLFSNTGVVDNNLLIDVSQWRNDDSHLIITGRSCAPEIGGFRSLCYITMTTLPSTSSCATCSFQEASPDFEDAHGDGVFVKSRCLQHCLTTHLVYERVPPFPKFYFDIQLKWKNSLLVNTGNALHIFSYNISEPQKESAFTSELLIPPFHFEPRISKVRLLRCGFWFKSTPNCLQKILQNCSAREAARIQLNMLNQKLDEAEEKNEECINAQIVFLSTLPQSMEFGPPASHFFQQPHARRLSQSSIDSDISSHSRSTNFSQQSTADIEFQEAESEKPLPSPKRVMSTAELIKVKTTMPPPNRRKFFKTGTAAATNKEAKMSTHAGLASSSLVHAPQHTYDIFEVGVEEVLLEGSLSSYRKRRNADKQYEFSDPDASVENLVPLKLSRNRQRRHAHSLASPGFGNPRSPRFSAENSASGESSRYEGVNVGAIGYPRSPRTLLIHSPAMSPNYPELGDILRPLTNNSFRSINSSPSPHPLFSPPNSLREFCDETSDVKLYSQPSSGMLHLIETESSEAFDKVNDAKPTLVTNLNCIAKILRSYVDRDDDNLSVKTDTDDEYSQTVPFPVALNLEVHGTSYQPLQLISNSKVKSSPTPVVEILQRTLEIEILCNEVAGMICLSSDKNFISCFDYDVAVLDICPEQGSVTALAVLLIQATTLRGNLTQGDGIDCTTQNPDLTLPNDRQKYEAMFSFVWEPVEENCRILYMGHLREIETIPETWHPMKQIIQRLETRSSGRHGSLQRVLSNELAVYEWQSLDELVHPSGLITLRSSAVTSNRGTPTGAFNFSSISNLDTEDEDLSD